MKCEQRLRRAADFSAVHRRGRGVTGEALALRSLQTGAPISRVGFAVGKRVGKAVVRNRVRRRLRAIVASLPLAPGRDIVISARPPAVSRGFWELRAELCGLLQQARLLPLPGPRDAEAASHGLPAPRGRKTEDSAVPQSTSLPQRLQHRAPREAKRRGAGEGAAQP
jgi:ribonuclease P protein component